MKRAGWTRRRRSNVASRHVASRRDASRRDASRCVAASDKPSAKVTMDDVRSAVIQALEEEFAAFDAASIGAWWLPDAGFLPGTLTSRRGWIELGGKNMEKLELPGGRWTFLRSTEFKGSVKGKWYAVHDRDSEGSEDEVFEKLRLAITAPSAPSVSVALQKQARKLYKAVQKARKLAENSIKSCPGFSAKVGFAGTVVFKKGRGWSPKCTGGTPIRDQACENCRSAHKTYSRYLIDCDTAKAWLGRAYFESAMLTEASATLLQKVGSKLAREEKASKSQEPASTSEATRKLCELVTQVNLPETCFAYAFIFAILSSFLALMRGGTYNWDNDQFGRETKRFCAVLMCLPQGRRALRLLRGKGFHGQQTHGPHGPEPRTYNPENFNLPIPCEETIKACVKRVAEPHQSPWNDAAIEDFVKLCKENEEHHYAISFDGVDVKFKTVNTRCRGDKVFIYGFDYVAMKNGTLISDLDAEMLEMDAASAREICANNRIYARHMITVIAKTLKIKAQFAIGAIPVYSESIESVCTVLTEAMSLVAKGAGSYPLDLLAVSSDAIPGNLNGVKELNTNLLKRGDRTPDTRVFHILDREHITKNYIGQLTKKIVTFRNDADGFSLNTCCDTYCIGDVFHGLQRHPPVLSAKGFRSLEHDVPLEEVLEFDEDETRGLTGTQMKALRQKTANEIASFLRRHITPRAVGDMDPMDYRQRMRLVDKDVQETLTRNRGLRRYTRNLVALMAIATYLSGDSGASGNLDEFVAAVGTGAKWAKLWFQQKVEVCHRIASQTFNNIKFFRGELNALKVRASGLGIASNIDPRVLESSDNERLHSQLRQHRATFSVMEALDSMRSIAAMNHFLRNDDRTFWATTNSQKKGPDSLEEPRNGGSSYEQRGQKRCRRDTAPEAPAQVRHADAIARLAQFLTSDEAEYNNHNLQTVRGFFKLRQPQSREEAFQKAHERASTVGRQQAMEALDLISSLAYYMKWRWVYQAVSSFELPCARVIVRHRGPSTVAAKGTPGIVELVEKRASSTPVRVSIHFGSRVIVREQALQNDGIYLHVDKWSESDAHMTNLEITHDFMVERIGQDPKIAKGFPGDAQLTIRMSAAKFEVEAFTTLERIGSSAAQTVAHLIAVREKWNSRRPP